MSYTRSTQSWLVTQGTPELASQNNQGAGLGSGGGREVVGGSLEAEADRGPRGHARQLP